jgi:seryl-tRNA synthetase
VNADSMRGTGQLPKFEEDLFKLNNGMYLIPTAEVPVTNIVRDEIIPADNLPIKLVAHTPCFRSEAGSYGRDTRGMIRQHQFDKVEMVQFVRPGRLLRRAGRTHRPCRGDPAETRPALPRHGPVQRRHRLFLGQDLRPGSLAAGAEHLPGNLLLFQLRGLPGAAHAGPLPRREKDGKPGRPELIHTLNGSGLAVGRTLVAMLENYQNPDGSVTIPEMLRPYMGGLDRLYKE